VEAGHAAPRRYHQAVPRLNCPENIPFSFPEIGFPRLRENIGNGPPFLPDNQLISIDKSTLQAVRNPFPKRTLAGRRHSYQKDVFHCVKE
jgi:hypothetical protein